MTTASLLILGLLLGLRHTLDLDHLIAMSTLVSQSRSLKRSAVLGALWGLGHTASLLAAGLLVLLVSWQPRSEDQPLLEGLVGVMLVVLGARLIWRLRRGHLHWHTHRHGDVEHAHPHIHVPGEAVGQHGHHVVGTARAPFLVGIVHGLAGSAAFVLLTTKYAQTQGEGLPFLVMFGLGTVVGMAAMSSLMTLPLWRGGVRLGRLQTVARAVAGSLSVAFGLYVVWEAGVRLAGGGS
jgi:ABC-type nickel/cobalt efflux system permease component RcnA